MACPSSPPRLERLPGGARPRDRGRGALPGDRAGGCERAQRGHTATRSWPPRGAPPELSAASDAVHAHVPTSPVRILSPRFRTSGMPRPSAWRPSTFAAPWTEPATDSLVRALFQPPHRIGRILRRHRAVPIAHRACRSAPSSRSRTRPTAAPFGARTTIAVRSFPDGSSTVATGWRNDLGFVGDGVFRCGSPGSTTARGGDFAGPGKLVASAKQTARRWRATRPPSRPALAGHAASSVRPSRRSISHSRPHPRCPRTNGRGAHASVVSFSAVTHAGRHLLPRAVGPYATHRSISACRRGSTSSVCAASWSSSVSLRLPVAHPPGRDTLARIDPAAHGIPPPPLGR